jgi:hypothetical protein
MKGKLDKTDIISAPMVLSLCLLSSVILSISILMRYFLTIDIQLRYLSLYFYIFSLLLVPIISLLFIFRITKLKTRLAKAFFLGVILLVYTLIIDISIGWFSTFDLIPEYLFYWIPLPLILFCTRTKFISNIPKKKIRLAFLVIAITVLLPNIIAFAGVSILENMANSISDPTEKASFISKHVLGMTVYEHKYRSNNDYWKFLLTGVGTCGEISMASIKMLADIGFETRRIEVSGENHAFTEIKIENGWKVIDGVTVQSREDWINNRISDVGCVTYLCTITDDSFTELIEDYTNKTDTITLIITQNGEPVAGAHVQLKHTFVMENGSQSILQTLPSVDRYFISDSNGTIKLHLGKPFYIGEFAGSELYYWVFVNDNNKTRVSSSGIGADQPPVEISLGN